MPHARVEPRGLAPFVKIVDRLDPAAEREEMTMRLDPDSHTFFIKRGSEERMVRDAIRVGVTAAAMEYLAAPHQQHAADLDLSGWHRQIEVAGRTPAIV